MPVPSKAMGAIGLALPCESAPLFTPSCPVQEEIQRRSRTGIVNKGSYHAPGAPPDEKEKPLFLRVVPGSDLPVDSHQHAPCQT
jgi:hypothetical protein